MSLLSFLGRNGILAALGRVRADRAALERQASEEIQRRHADLEQRVAIRSAELARKNQELEAESARRDVRSEERRVGKECCR